MTNKLKFLFLLLALGMLNHSIVDLHTSDQSFLLTKDHFYTICNSFLAPSSIFLAKEASLKKETLRKNMPWIDLIRNPAQAEPDENNWYWQNNAEARERFLNHLEDMQSLEYKSKTDKQKNFLFQEMLIQAHSYATEGMNGDRLYRSGIAPGAFRQTNQEFGSSLNSIYKEEAVNLAKIIDEFNQKHNQTFSYNSAYLNAPKPAFMSVSVSIPQSQKITEEVSQLSTPEEIQDYYKNLKRSSSPVPINKGSSHTYPDMSYWDTYLNSARIQLENILSISQKNAPEEWVTAIAQLYHTLLNIRPFDQINNSLFMNFVNALLRRQGLEGIPHEILDHIAMRLSVDDFKIFFLEKVKERNPGLSAANPVLNLVTDRSFQTVKTAGQATQKDAVVRNIILHSSTKKSALQQVGLFLNMKTNGQRIDYAGGVSLNDQFLSLISYESIMNLQMKRELSEQSA